MRWIRPVSLLVVWTAVAYGLAASANAAPPPPPPPSPPETIFPIPTIPDPPEPDCVTYAYIEGYRTEWDFGLVKARKAHGNGWGRIDCDWSNPTALTVEVTVEPGGKNTNVATCDGRTCGAAASVNEGIGEADTNCFSTFAEGASGKTYSASPAAEAHQCG